MQFNIKSTKVKISFSFFIFFLVSALNDRLDIYLKSLLASLLHEAVHIIFIYFFENSVSEITLNILGGKIEKTHQRILSNYKEAFINLSAPFFNIFLGLTAFIFNNKSKWAHINLFIGFFNLLPFYTFDGGRGIFFLLSNKFDYKITNKIVFSLSVIVATIFTLVSAYVFFYYKHNYIFVIFSIYMLISLFLFKLLWIQIITNVKVL